MSNDLCKIINYGLIKHWFSFLFSFTQGHVSVTLNLRPSLKWTTAVKILEGFDKFIVIETR